MTETAPSRTDELVDYVRSKVAALQNGSRANRSEAVGDLAVLRRARGLDGDPRVWTVLFEGMPESLRGTDDRPSTAENAIQAALCLFAVHEQAAATDMHVRNRRLGTAVQALAQEVNGDGWQEGSVAKRFHSVALADGWDARMHHLRGLVTQLRAAGEPLDYGLLAKDLEQLQHPNLVQNVRMRWGRDFHYIKSTKETR